MTGAGLRTKLVEELQTRQVKMHPCRIVDVWYLQFQLVLLQSSKTTQSPARFSSHVCHLASQFPSSLFIIRKSLHLERSCFGRGQRIEGSGLRRFLALFSCFSAASIKQSCVVSSALKLHEATGSLHRRAQTAFFVAVKGQFSKILHSTSKIHRLTADPSPSPLVDSKLSFC